VTSARVAAVDPALARDEARDILGGERFRDSDPPRPLRGALEWLADRLRGATDVIGSWLEPVPGPTWLAIGVIALAILTAAIVATVRRRRGGVVASGALTAVREEPRERAADLEREADEAEQRGDWERAVRLRFRAGLRRLADAGVIDLRPGVTNGAVGRRLASPDYDRLAADFDEVAYGGRAASEPDAATAREGWPRVLTGSRR